MEALPQDRSPAGLYRWMLGRDDHRTLALVGGYVVVYLIVDEFVTRWSQAPGPVYLESTLIGGVITEQSVLSALAVVGAGALIAIGRARLFCRWDDLELGRALRWLSIPLIVVLVWRSGFYEYHYVYDQWHAVDRVLIVALGVGAIVRPILLLPFVVQTWVISWQFGVLLGGTASMNIDAPARAVLLAVAVGVVFHVVAGIRAGLTSLWFSGVIVAAWFFLPGRRKLRIDWLTTEPADFARTSEAAGWLGATGGAFNDFMVDLLTTFRWPVLLGTLLLELGAIVAVVSRRTLVWWLPGWIAFHVVIFAASGFWLFPWVVVEATLLVAYRNPDVRASFAQVGGVVRSGFAVVLVLLGGQLFDPAGLAWIDSPVAQVYEVEVVTESGERLNVPLTEFEPMGLEAAFMMFGVEDPVPAVGAYGALGSRWELDLLTGMTSFDEFDDYRAQAGSPDSMREFYGQRVLLDWVDHVNTHGDPAWVPFSPLPRIWSDRAEPVHDWEPVTRLDLIRVDVLHRHDLARSTVVFSVGLDADGSAMIIPTGDDE